jgi:hypothetical protein
MRMKKPKLSVFKIIAIVLATLAALILLSVAYIIVYLWWVKSHQVTPSKANQICQEFYQDVQTQITRVPGYRIIQGDKSCDPEQDEANLTDYILSVEFKVSKDGNDSVAGIKNNLNNLAANMPHKNYLVSIDNMQNEEPNICVNASRYIDNDGKDYPQGDVDGPKATYTPPGSIRGFAPCSDL